MVKIGFIGVGYWGKNLLRAFSFLPQAEIVMVSDLDEKNLKHAKTMIPTTTVTTKFDDVFNHPEIQGIIIATPSATHFQVAKKSLLSKKHTFVEKPLSMDVHEGEELVKISKDVNRTLFVGHLLKHHPASDYLRKMISAGEFGEVHYIYTQRLNLGIIRTDENPLWSLAPHDISLILYFFNEMPTQAWANGASFLKKELEDVIFAGLKFASGHIAHLHLSWLDPHKTRSITIVGSQKMAVFDDMEPREKLKIYDKGATKQTDSNSLQEYHSVREGDIFLPKIDGTEPLRLEAQNFLNCIEGKAQIKSDGPEAVRILKVIKALDESLKEGGRVVNL